MQRDKDFGLVVLNYLNYHDTIELIQNLHSQDWFDQVRLYVVDNNSCNESVDEIRKIQKKIQFTFLISKKNLGFAKGENIGFRKALEDGCIFISSINNDTLIDKRQVDFLDRIRSVYKNDNSIGLITINIENLDGVRQNPLKEFPPSLLKIAMLKLFFLLYLHKVYYFLRVYVFYNLVNKYVDYREKLKVVENANAKLSTSRYIYAAHGSFLVFTPSFFEYFSGHNEQTFLFCEEFIRAEETRGKGLKTWLCMDLTIKHKESRTIKMYTRTRRNKVIFLLKNMFVSCKIYAKILKFKD